MYRDLSNIDEFIIEVEITPYCNLNCSYCENKNSLSEYQKRYIDYIKLVDYINFIQSNINQKIIVILNGGEPTLHPNIDYICNNINSNISIQLLTNFYKDYEFYNSLPDNIQIFFSYHSEIDPISFIEKYKKVVKNKKLILMQFDEDKKQIFENSSIEYILKDIESIDYKLNSIDDNTKIFLAQLPKYKICTIQNKYIYIDSTGYIWKCMFCNNSIVGNISKLELPKKISILCKNNYCFYKVGQKKL